MLIPKLSSYLIQVNAKRLMEGVQHHHFLLPWNYDIAGVHTLGQLGWSSGLLNIRAAVASDTALVFTSICHAAGLQDSKTEVQFPVMALGFI